MAQMITNTFRSLVAPPAGPGHARACGPTPAARGQPCTTLAAPSPQRCRRTRQSAPMWRPGCDSMFISSDVRLDPWPLCRQSVQASASSGSTAKASLAGSVVVSISALAALRRYGRSAARKAGRDRELPSKIELNGAREASDTDAAVQSSRRDAALSTLLAAGLLPFGAGAEPGVATGPQRLFVWSPANTGDQPPDLASSSVEEVFKRIEEEAFSLDFIAYLTRFLLNFDDGAATWWSKEVMPTVPRDASVTDRAALFRKRFAEFAASVEFGLRRYIGTESRRRQELLEKLAQKYGTDSEARRHLALAFTLLDEQPTRLIAELLAKNDPTQRFFAVFSPALTDYLAMDPRRLLPDTQFPLWDGGQKRWVVKGLDKVQRFLPVEDQEVNSIFGPRSNSLLSQERPLRPIDFILFALSGAAGCAFTHSLVIPLDVVKTRMQTQPDGFAGAGLLDGAKQIGQTEGWPALLRGWEPTVLGYLFYGITVYPGYEFFKRLYLAIAGPVVVSSFRVPLVLLAGASATVIACIGVCPAEAVRIRMVSDDSLRGDGFAGIVRTIANQDGLSTLYDGFTTILVRQVLFGMMKFLVFDYFADFIFDIFPELTQQMETQLAVSLLSGAVAGVVSSVVSQPADTVLSKMNQEAGRRNFLDVAGDIFKELGAGGFFLGLGSRCVWAGCIISGQFFLYDVCKSFFGIKDLRIFLDVQI